MTEIFGSAVLNPASVFLVVIQYADGFVVMEKESTGDRVGGRGLVPNMTNYDQCRYDSRTLQRDLFDEVRKSSLPLTLSNGLVPHCLSREAR